MKKVVTILAIVVAVAGVFVAKANENKRVFSVTEAYYSGTQLFAIGTGGSTNLTTTVTSGKEAKFQIGTGTAVQLTDAAIGGNSLYVP